MMNVAGVVEEGEESVGETASSALDMHRDASAWCRVGHVQTPGNSRTWTLRSAGRRWV